MVGAAVLAAMAAANGATTLTVDNALGVKLVQSGVDAAPIAPAVQDGLVFTFPGAAKASTRTQVVTRGGLDLENVHDQIDLRLQRLTFSYGRKRIRVSGQALLGGVPNGRFTFAAGRRRAGAVTLRLTDVGATALNSQFNVTNVFAAGDRLGVARIAR